MYERFTDRSRKVMQFANQKAQEWNHEYIGTEHVALGLLKEGSGTAMTVLLNLGISSHDLGKRIEDKMQKGPAEMITMGKLPQTPRCKQVIECAIEEARGFSHNYVGTEHLLLGLIRSGSGIAGQVFQELGVEVEKVREEILSLLGHGKEEEPSKPTFKPISSNKEIMDQLFLIEGEFKKLVRMLWEKQSPG